MMDIDDFLSRISWTDFGGLIAFIRRSTSSSPIFSNSLRAFAFTFVEITEYCDGKSKILNLVSDNVSASFEYYAFECYQFYS